MARKIAFYQQIVESMDEGVMALDTQGEVILFNDAAARILDMDPESVRGRPFGQVFMMDMEGNDLFCDTILNAVYKSGVGLTDTMEFTRKDGDVRVISMSTSYLKTLAGADGKGKDEAGTDQGGDGVVVVLNDITEISRSREKEKALNHELSAAFLQMEESKRRLERALKKVKWIRFFIVFAVVVGLSGTAGFLWFNGDLSSALFSSETAGPHVPGQGMVTATVTKQPLTAAISLSGSVAPLEEINVVAPFEGKIKGKYFIYDQKVEKGAPLVLMDTTRLEVELRQAKSSYIKAEQSFKQVLDWEKSVEVSNAKRNFTKTRISLDASRRKLEESRLLFEKGIIAGSELKSAESDFTNQQMDLKASEESLASVLDKGSKENVDIARMELANARVNLEEIQEKLSRSRVDAPVSGIILKPARQNSGKGSGGSKTLEPGLSVSQGEVLLTVGNLDGLSVKSKVDEIDIGKIQFGQKVRVAGDAFAGIPLTGRVRHISSNAVSTGNEGPMFDVDVAIENLTSAHREKIRLGMSTNLEIMVYDNPEALVLPLAAVEVRGTRKFVKILEAGDLLEREIVTGLTTLDAVEVVQGLVQGDLVYYQPLMGGPSRSHGELLRN
jgi:PAS domain S-box-containing protein